MHVNIKKNDNNVSFSKTSITANIIRYLNKVLLCEL